MTIHLPSKTRMGFIAVYSMLALVLVGAAFSAGKGMGYLRIESKPAYCKGDLGFSRCAVDVVASLGAAGSSVVCTALKTTGKYLCDVRFAGICYDLPARRSREGYPIVGTPSQRPTC